MGYIPIKYIYDEFGCEQATRQEILQRKHIQQKKRKKKKSITVLHASPVSLTINNRLSLLARHIADLCL